MVAPVVDAAPVVAVSADEARDEARDDDGRDEARDDDGRDDGAAARRAENARLAQARVVLFDERSPFQRVFVVEEDGHRILRFDDVAGNDQSSLDLKNKDRVVFEYVRLAGLATRLVRDPARALVVGLGGGAFPRLLVQRHPKIVVDVVELDPVVVDAARRFFDLPQTPRLQVHVGDGVDWLARARPAGQAGYDVVLLDAFSGDGIPAPLSSKAFFDDARRVLADRGVAVLNIALVSDADADLITRRFSAAFPGCVVVTGKHEDNRVLFGARLPLDKDALRVAALTSSAFLPYDAHLDVDVIRPCP